MVAHKLDESLRWCEPEPSLFNDRQCYSAVNSGLSTGIHNQGNCSGYNDANRASPYNSVFNETLISFTCCDGEKRHAIRVERDGHHIGTIIKVPTRYHLWELQNIHEEPIARFRASRAFSWLNLLDGNGVESIVPQKFCWGFGRIEWMLSDREFIRWSRINQSMVYISGQDVFLPEFAKFNELPKLSLKSNNGFHSSFMLKYPINLNDHNFNIMIATAFISMWRWSREPQSMKTARAYTHYFCVKWMSKNLCFERLPSILAISAQNNAIGTCAASH